MSSPICPPPPRLYLITDKQWPAAKPPAIALDLRAALACVAPKARRRQSEPRGEVKAGVILRGLTTQIYAEYDLVQSVSQKVRARIASPVVNLTDEHLAVQLKIQGD